MRFELMNSRCVKVLTTERQFEVSGQLGLLLRLLLIADGKTITKDEVAGLLRVRIVSVPTYIKNLRERLGGAHAIESGPVGYRIDQLPHGSDVRDLAESLSQCERLLHGHDVFDLPLANAREILPIATEAKDLWFENPALGLEDVSKGIVAAALFAGMQASLVRALNTARVCLADGGYLADAIRDLEASVSGTLEELPDESAWGVLALAYYRDQQPLHADSVFHRAEAFYDQMDSRLPPKLLELQRRMKLHDVTLSSDGIALSQTLPVVPRMTPALESYLLRVISTNDRLLFGDPTISDRSRGGMMTLRSAFFSTKVVDVVNAEHEGRVTDMLERPAYRTAMLIGDPGSGKSTVIRYLAAQTAHSIFDKRANGITNDMIVPISVRLADISVVGNDKVTMWQGVRELGSERDALEPELQAWMTRGQAAIYFDGLDEVHDDDVRLVLDLIEATRIAYPHCRIVVTCRTDEYESAAPSRRLPIRTLRFVPLDVDEIVMFLDRWCDALAGSQFLTVPMNRREGLADLFRTRVEMSRIGEVPFLLVLILMTDVQEEACFISLPKLYERVVMQLLSEIPAWRTDSSSEERQFSGIFETAAEVAFELHQRDERNDGSDKGGLLLSELESIVARDSLDSALILTPEKYAVARREVLADLLCMTKRNGLIREQSAGRYACFHKSIQELLAAIHLTTKMSRKEILARAVRSHWRSPLLLVAQLRARDDNDITPFIVIASVLADPTRKEPPFDPVDIVMAAELLVALGSADAGRTPAELSSRIAFQLLDLAEDDTLDQSVRVHSLEVLARLGDPRYVDPNGNVKTDEGRLVELSQLEMTVGSDVPRRPFGAKNDPAVSPRSLTVPAFSAGRFPVTNLEYARFVDAGGYEDPSFWSSKDAQRWFTADGAFIVALIEQAMSRPDYDLDPELRELFREDRRRALVHLDHVVSRRHEPVWWRNERFNSPTQPVVGLNMWEANAYCAWLTQQGMSTGWLVDGCRVRLPGEWEWERIGTDARGELSVGFQLWTDDHRSRAHTKFDGLGLDRPLPVGAFPMGQAPSGAEDLVGNVWEWTRSRVVPYAELEEGDDTGGDFTERIVRGASWFSMHEQLTSPKYRGYALPYLAYFDIGFRIVIVEEDEPGPSLPS